MSDDANTPAADNTADEKRILAILAFMESKGGKLSKTGMLDIMRRHRTGDGEPNPCRSGNSAGTLQALCDAKYVEPVKMTGGGKRYQLLDGGRDALGKLQRKYPDMPVPVFEVGNRAVDEDAGGVDDEKTEEGPPRKGKPRVRRLSDRELRAGLGFYGHKLWDEVRARDKKAAAGDGDLNPAPSEASPPAAEPPVQQSSETASGDKDAEAKASLSSNDRLALLRKVHGRRFRGDDGARRTP